MNVYQSIRDSLYKVCKDFAANDGWNATIYNFDAFSENNALPAGDLIGLHGYTLDGDSELVTVRCMIGIATQDDENLFRLDEKAGKLFQHVCPKATFAVVDSADRVTEIGRLTIGDGTSISPVYQAQLRPLKFLDFKGFCSVPLSR